MKDILDSLKIRFNSPLIISFIISWIFWNWQIMIALIWYSGVNLKEKTGFNNYIDFINEYTTFGKSLIYPLLSAIGYTLLFPVIKWGISVFNAFISTKENNHVLKVSDEAYVPTEIFLKSNKEAKERIHELSEILKNEGVKHAENAKLITEQAALKNEINQYIDDNNRLELKIIEDKKYYDLISSKAEIKNLTGYWAISIKDTEKNLEFSYNISILGRKGEIMQSNNNNHAQFSIKNFVYNPVTSKLSIVFITIDGSTMNNTLQTTRIVITEAIWIENIIESTSDNISRFNLHMTKIK